jgi:hypothetical protein
MNASVLLLLVVFFSANSHAAINCPLDSSNSYDSVVKIIGERPNGEPEYCTGTILKGGCFVLTAAHCVVHKGAIVVPAKFKIKSGVNSEIDIGPVQSVYSHPDFKEFERNDVALLKLSKCVSKGGMDIEYGPFTSDRKVIVGGYGVRNISSSVSQPSRYMGENKITEFNDQKICLGPIKVGKDGQKILSGSGCLPVGQDSGSAFIQNGKIRGVHNSAEETWLDNGVTLVERSCATNLRNPSVRSFIEDTLNQTTPSATNPKDKSSLGFK